MGGNFGLDLAQAFEMGKRHKQQREEHEQRIEENNLRRQILKHNIDRTKIEDQVMERNLALQQAQMLQGQPAKVRTEAVDLSPGLGPAAQAAPVAVAPQAALMGVPTGELPAGQDGPPGPQTVADIINAARSKGIGAMNVQATAPMPAKLERTVQPGGSFPIPAVGNQPAFNMPIQTREEQSKEAIRQAVLAMQMDLTKKREEARITAESAAPTIIPEGGTAINRTGKVIGYGGAKEKEGEAGLTQAMIKDFAVTNQRDPTPAEKVDLISKSHNLFTASTAKDPLVQELAQARIDDLKNKGTQDLPPRVATRIDRQVNQFHSEPIVKRYNTVNDAVQFINGLDLNSKNPADDQALIYAFAKAMDPDSVVREGEYATVFRYSQSWLERFGFNAKRVIENSEFMSPEVRANLKKTIAERAKPVLRQYDNLYKDYARRIDKITGRNDGIEHLPDYGGAFSTVLKFDKNGNPIK